MEGAAALPCRGVDARNPAGLSRSGPHAVPCRRHRHVLAAACRADGRLRACECESAPVDGRWFRRGDLSRSARGEQRGARGDEQEVKRPSCRAADRSWQNHQLIAGTAPWPRPPRRPMKTRGTIFKNNTDRSAAVVRESYAIRCRMRLEGPHEFRVDAEVTAEASCRRLPPTPIRTSGSRECRGRGRSTGSAFHVTPLRLFFTSEAELRANRVETTPNWQSAGRRTDVRESRHSLILLQYSAAPPWPGARLTNGNGLTCAATHAAWRLR